MSTPPYPRSTKDHPNVRVSLQRINEMSTGCSTTASSSGINHSLTTDEDGNTETVRICSPGMAVLTGATVSSSTTDPVAKQQQPTTFIDDSNNTLSEYLNASELYDSVKGGIKF